MLFNRLSFYHCCFHGNSFVQNVLKSLEQCQEEVMISVSCVLVLYTNENSV